MVRCGHLPLLLTAGLASLVASGPARAGVGGYTLNRIIVWAEAGDPNPRFQQDPETREFAILFPAPPNPLSPWQPVKARRFISHNGGFRPAGAVAPFQPQDAFSHLAPAGPAAVPRTQPAVLPASARYRNR